MSKESDHLFEKQKKLFMLLGISVYEGQQIEYKLKVLSEFYSHNYDDLIFSKKENLDKKSLGIIFNELKKRQLSLNHDGQLLIDKFIEERNIVVHHLLISDLSIKTEERINEKIKFLEQYRETIQIINSIFDPILYSALIIMYENTEVVEDIEKYQNNLNSCYQFLDESLKKGSGELRITLEDPKNIDEYFNSLIQSKIEHNQSDELNIRKEKNKLWQKTKIISAVRNISQKIADQDGWMSLSVCCQYLKEEDPEIKPEKYGFKKIKKILEISNLFEIKKVPHQNHKTYTVYFRFLQNKYL